MTRVADHRLPPEAATAKVGRYGCGPAARDQVGRVACHACGAGYDEKPVLCVHCGGTVFEPLNTTSGLKPPASSLERNDMAKGRPDRARTAGPDSSPADAGRKRPGARAL